MKSTTYDMKGLKPQVSGTLWPYSGSGMSLTDADILGDSISITHGTSVPGEFTVGGVILGSLSLTLLNNPTRNLSNGKPDYTSGRFSNFDWKGSHITLWLTTDDGSHSQSVYMGDYFVDSHSEAGTTIALQCYDRLKFFDEYQLYEAKQDTQNPLFTNGQSTTYDAILNICNRRGINDIRGLDRTMDTLPIYDPNSDFMTERTFLSYCAQMLGKFAVIRYSGTSEYLLFTSYNTSTHHYDYDAGATFSHDLRTENITITGVKVVSYDDKYIHTKGTTAGYQIVIEDNPLITYLTAGAVSNRINTQYHLESGSKLTYRPGTVEIVGTPVIEAGDIIKVRTGQESDIYMICTNIRYNTGLTISITADADPADSDLRLSRSQYVKKMSKQAITDELNDPDSDLSKALGGGEPGELITLPAVEVIVRDKNNPSTIPFGQYDGHMFIWDADPTSYTPGSPAPLELIERQGTNGFDICSITYPEQNIRIPADVGEKAYIDLTITKIKTPTSSEYTAAGYSSTAAANRDCPFYPFVTNPHKIRCRVTRELEYVIFEPYEPQKYDTNILTTGFDRSLAWFSGFGNIPRETAYSQLEYPLYRYAIPSCEIPLPGMYYDLVSPDDPNHALTGHKWFYLTHDGQGHTVINVIPYYDPDDPTVVYYIKYLTD